MGVTPSACACALCKHMGKPIHREWIARRRAELAASSSGYNHERDLEAEVAESWHSYRRHLERVSHDLPQRAVHLSYTAKETPVLRRLRDWCDRIGEFENDEDSNIAVLAGPPGTGKTVAAVWLLLHRWAAETPRFMTSMELARIPRYGEERDAILNCGALVIDDLGVERTDDKFTADLDELIDRFYRGYGELVITTNCTNAEFSKRYGIRVLDRLAERGAWIPASGKSMRGRRAGALNRRTT